MYCEVDKDLVIFIYYSNTESKVQTSVSHKNINLFVTNVHFLYHLLNIRKPYGFLMFSGDRERVH